ncbi:uncharacterized protein LOC113306125 [Papaver somniferum]|uniref:uncharacterized protein LOC113306125 n=1 Tax=Papaver somniferum TaxID=3469 RepID=UPI000E702624|nr:uncharacterized protein LOC113306125 [Papaver somniferum]
MVELWHTRNEKIYENAELNFEKFKQTILSYTKACGIRMKGPKLPRNGQVLICCDGASKGNLGNAGLDFVARNENGDCLGESTGGLGVATNFLAEVMALVVAGEWEVKKKYVNVVFSLDSKVVLLAFSNGKIPWVVMNRWNNIRRHIPRISFTHSYREINFSADNMAKKGVLLARGIVVYYDDKPYFLNKLECEDGIYFRFCS